MKFAWGQLFCDVICCNSRETRLFVKNLRIFDELLSSKRHQNHLIFATQVGLEKTWKSMFGIWTKKFFLFLRYLKTCFLHVVFSIFFISGTNNNFSNRRQVFLSFIKTYLYAKNEVNLRLLLNLELVNKLRFWGKFWTKNLFLYSGSKLRHKKVEVMRISFGSIK